MRISGFELLKQIDLNTQEDSDRKMFISLINMGLKDKDSRAQCVALEYVENQKLADLNIIEGLLYGKFFCFFFKKKNTVLENSESLQREIAIKILVKMLDLHYFNDSEKAIISPVLHRQTNSESLDVSAGSIQILLAFYDQNSTKLIGPIIRVLEESRNAQLLKNILDGMKKFDLKFCKYETVRI